MLMIFNQIAVFYKKNKSEMLKSNLFMFLGLLGPWDENKN